ncbi:hypothetical protein [Psychrobacter urativorans]|uniref:hypothetical protein n=1 Tax=Psychrobacter urativorans TaxID=45610 RepID=UPI00191B75C8|nr:hypothetical protein [Psychrobacter urativorans]
MDANLYFALSSGFPQIVGLLATFYSINNDKIGLDDFKEWLDETNNEYAIKMIENSTQLQNNLSNFMNANHEENMNKLSELTDLVIDIASKIEGLDKLTDSFIVNNNLSEQAVSILRQFVKSKSPNMHYMNNSSLDGYQHDYILEGPYDIEYDDSVFIEDDIKSLVDKGLITKTFNSKGGIIYNITRQAVAFIKSTDN